MTANSSGAAHEHRADAMMMMMIMMTMMT